MTEEYGWLISECGMTLADVGAIAKNGFHVADMSGQEKAAAMLEIDDVLVRYSRG